MRALLIHADRFEYESRSPTKMAEELAPDHPKKHSFQEVLVVFTTVESSDDDIAAVAENVASDVADVCGKVEAQRVVIYPYAHLSSRLASPAVAVDALKAVEAAIRSKDVEVHRAPFGWYKAFEIRCKGHPLSELSRSLKTRWPFG